jgi:hypothetical protein
VVPFLFLIYIFLFIRYLLRRGKQKPNFSFQAVLVIASIIFVFSITAHQSQEVSTGGVFKVEEKLKEGTKYYLELDNKKVRVSYNEFQLVEENQQYLISFVWNKRTPNIGKLDTIEPLGD